VKNIYSFITKNLLKIEEKLKYHTEKVLARYFQSQHGHMSYAMIEE